MKKFYSLLAAGAVIFSAAASVSGSGAKTLSTKAPKRTVKTHEVASFPTQPVAVKDSKSIRGMRKADSNPSIEGGWAFYVGDFYLEDKVNYGLAIYDYYMATVVPTEEGDSIYFEPCNDGRMQFRGTWNSEENTFSIKKEHLEDLKTSNGLMEIYQQPFEYVEEIDDVKDIDALVGTYFPEEGLITFPANQGIYWPGLINGVEEGWFDALDFILGNQFDDSQSNAGEWTDIGMATFVDGWLVPAMGLNQQQNSYTVPLQQSDNNKYVYRLVDPYQLGPVAPYNMSETPGYIVFDISDKDHVIFLPSDAGFVNGAIIPGGITQFYVYNKLGEAVTSLPDMSLEDIIAMEASYIPFTTYKNNTITLGSIRSPETGQTVFDANFGTQFNPFGGMTWGGANMTASITFPNGYNAEVADICVDENAPVEYFNLQGQRVINPAKGQIVIKRQGGATVKELVK